MREESCERDEKVVLEVARKALGAYDRLEPFAEGTESGGMRWFACYVDGGDERIAVALVTDRDDAGCEDFHPEYERAMYSLGASGVLKGRPKQLVYGLVHVDLEKRKCRVKLAEAIGPSQCPTDLAELPPRFCDEGLRERCLELAGEVLADQGLDCIGLRDSGCFDFMYLDEDAVGFVVVSAARAEDELSGVRWLECHEDEALDEAERLAGLLAPVVSDADVCVLEMHLVAVGDDFSQAVATVFSAVTDIRIGAALQTAE